MVGEPHAYRVRVGDCRIVYDVLDDRLAVQVVRTPSCPRTSLIGGSRP